MKTTSYYLVEPNSSMQELLSSSSGSELASFIPRSFLFSREEGGQAGDTIQDRITWAKLLFLAFLRRECGPIPECKQIFEHAQISVEEFDRWWKIERYHLEEVFEAVEEGIDEQTAALFMRTNSPLVDEWIAGLQARGKADET